MTPDTEIVVLHSICGHNIFRDVYTVHSIVFCWILHTVYLWHHIGGKCWRLWGDGPVCPTVLQWSRIGDCTWSRGDSPPWVNDYAWKATCIWGKNIWHDKENLMCICICIVIFCYCINLPFIFSYFELQIVIYIIPDQAETSSSPPFPFCEKYMFYSIIYGLFWSRAVGYSNLQL